MRRSTLWAFGLSLVLLLPPLALVQAQDKPDLGANAAVKYWQAFAFLPPLDKAQDKILEDWNKVPLDAAALSLLDASRRSLEYFHRGARLSRCDWSLNYEDGIGLLLPQGPKAIILARLAALDARRQFEEGHGEAGWQDVTDLLRLARHVGTGPLFILRMVAMRIETMAIDAASPYLLSVKTKLPKDASAALDSLPPWPTLAEMIETEKQVGAVWMIKAMKEAEHRQKGSWRTVWNQVLGAPGDGEVIDRNVAQSAQSFEQAIKILENILPLYDELARICALPPKEFDARYAEFTKKVEATGKPSGYMLPNVGRVIPIERRNEAQLAMLKAGIAVIQGGQGKLKTTKDPFGDGPIGYRPLRNGFELTSKLVFKGQPVTLRVGKGS